MSEELPVTEETEHKLNLRHLTIDDYDDVKKMWYAIYDDFYGYFNEKLFRTQLKVFLKAGCVLRTMVAWWRLPSP